MLSTKIPPDNRVVDFGISGMYALALSKQEESQPLHVRIRATEKCAEGGLERVYELDRPSGCSLLLPEGIIDQDLAIQRKKGPDGCIYRPGAGPEGKKLRPIGRSKVIALPESFSSDNGEQQ